MVEAQPWRGQSLRRVIKLFQHGERFSPEELVLIDAYMAGLPLASIEAETLASPG
ncbi:MAG: hypothetical protein IPL96_01805 [Holophagaceae bacterium]|nr:hypothetical protein [Holophagaceae bacterium]